VQQESRLHVLCLELLSIWSDESRPSEAVCYYKMCHDLPLLAWHPLCLWSTGHPVVVHSAAVEGRRAFYRRGVSSERRFVPAVAVPSRLEPCSGRTCNLNTEKIERVNFRARHSLTVFDKGKGAFKEKKPEGLIYCLFNSAPIQNQGHRMIPCLMNIESERV
jgi:hypothetical protein